MASGGLRYYLSLDSSGFSRGARQAEGDLSRLQRASASGFGAVKLGGLAAATAIGGTFAAAMRTGINEMMEADKVGAQTAATIRSTGGAAGVTRKEVEGLASQLQALTGVEDDAIQSGQNVLLTFTKIGQETFPRATKAALDLSVAFGKDMNASALMVGKALQDPVKGVTALSRVGVSFTAQQKDQIKAMVEAGNAANAQRLILRELERQVGGSGKAFGETLPGKLQRLKRAWEDTSQSIAVAFLPVLEKVANGALRNKDKLQSAFQGVARAVSGMVDFVGAIIDGDWKRAWNLAATGAGKALRAIGELAKRILYPLAKQAGEKIVEGMAAGVDSALARVPGGGALRRILGFESANVSSTITVRTIYGGGLASNSDVTPDRAAVPGQPRLRAMGGWIPGVYDARDDVPAMLSRGEVVLNPRQASLVGIGRINSALAATGGVMGGHAFARGGVAGCGCAACRGGRYASGGWVYPAPGASKGGGPGGGTHDYSKPPNNWQSDTAYDLMGVDGGSVIAPHDGVISGVRPFSSDPRFWGMAAYLDVPGGQFYLKHLKSLAVKPGQRVSAGQLIGRLGVGVNGGPHLHIGATSRALLERAVNGSASVKGGASGHETSDAEAKDAPPGLGLKDFNAQVPRLKRGGRATPGGLTDIASIEERHADDGLEERKITAAGGKRSAVIKNQIAELKQDVKDITARLKSLVKRRGTIDRERRKLIREASNPKTTRVRRQRIAERLAELNDTRTSIVDAINTLAEDRDDTLRQAAILGYDLSDAVKDEAAADAETAGGGGDSDTSGPTEGKTTSRNSGLTDYLASIGEFNAVKRGPGDLGAGGRTAWDATWTPAGGAVTVVVQTLHPGDPSVLADVGRTVVASMSGLPSTPSTTYMSGA